MNKDRTGMNWWPETNASTSPVRLSRGHRLAGQGWRPPRGYLGDGKVQADVDDDGEEEDVEGRHHQQGLLQHEHLVERVVDLRRRTNTALPSAAGAREASLLRHCRGPAGDGYRPGGREGPQPRVL